MLRTNILLSSEQYKLVKEYGFKNNLSISAVVRQALEKFLGPIQADTVKSPKPVAKSVEKFLESHPPQYPKVGKQRGEWNAQDYL